MSVPAKKRPASATKRRRSHLALKKVNLTKCPECKNALMAHQACAICGYYKGKEVIKIKTLKKKTKSA